MNVSMNWISDYVDLSGLDREELIHRFTLSTAEVEDVYHYGAEINGVVVAEITSIENHPNSKKLHLLELNLGDHTDRCVCGAPNVRVGMRVPFAPFGASVVGMTIGEATIAGVVSRGMCCSAAELGIADSSSGLLELPEDAPLGKPIKELWHFDDIVFEVDNKSLTNRPDLWGHYGIAREFAAIAKRPLKPMALVLIKDKLRDNVQDTVNYFKEQGVTLKVISGDSIKTVKNIAKDCGIEGAERAVNMTEVKTNEELEKVAKTCNVFGRVTPVQKKKLVLALKAKGHKVAMTGDGVNDVLALKEADCSVAMASGSEAARNVSQLVLTDNDFAAMPRVVAEGRRSINNLERSSSLYLVKTVYSILLSIFFIFATMQYPFEPIQLTLIGGLTIGLPSFVLALQPNKNIVKGNFTFNIIARALPAALCVALNIIIAEIFCKNLGIEFAQFSTISVYVTALTCLLLVIRLSLPLNALRGAMLFVSIAGITIAFTFFGWLFSLTMLSTNAIILLAVLAAGTIIVFNILYNIASKLIEENKNKS